jgi:hypothetical protein
MHIARRNAGTSQSSDHGAPVCLLAGRGHSAAARPEACRCWRLSGLLPCADPNGCRNLRFAELLSGLRGQRQRSSVMNTTTPAIPAQSFQGITKTE